MDFVPRGQSRVVLFVEPVLRTAVFVLVQLATKLKEFQTKLKELIHQGKIMVKNLSAKEQELLITKNSYK